jgi:Protein of unknown function (DUF1501)
MSCSRHDRLSITSAITRRQLFSRLSTGFSGLALAALIGKGRVQGASPTDDASSLSSQFDVLPKRPHFECRARAVIQLFMPGGPSHVDLFDPKPELEKRDGQDPPAEISDEEKVTNKLLKSPFKFAKYGQAGLDFAEILPQIARHADDLAIVRSVYSEHRNHEQAMWMLHSGMIVSGRPTIGAWVTYGLGSENQNLPAFVVLNDLAGLPTNGMQNWSSGWLPPLYQGTPFRSEGMPVLNLLPKQPRPDAIERGRMEYLSRLNQRHLGRHTDELELDARIASFELAARMQLSATDALDLANETEETRKLYGLDRDVTRSYGTRCLLARRLVERGVRFVQLTMPGQPWDTHTNNAAGTRSCCDQTDQPVAALLADLKRIGLFESTLVFWAGEFGRTPAAQGKDGRDHHPYGFSVWLAGGGIRGGQTYGATDPFGHHAIENRVSMADLHGTILHLLGLDYRQLSFRHLSRDERLTDVHEARILESLIG